MPFFVPLMPHPASPPSAPLEISAQGDLTTPTLLTVEFKLSGDLTRIRRPAPASPGGPSRRDRLWEHTCFEVFTRAAHSAKPYAEYNFSLSGDWAAYRFDDYRANPALIDVRTPRILLEQRGGTLSLTAAVELAAESIRSDVPLFLNVTAVVEAIDGTLSYWAPAHPAPQPDFHHPDGFGIKLTMPHV